METRIIHLVLNLKMGGLETWVVNFSKKIKESRFLPMVCCLESNTDLGQSLKDNEIPIVTLDKKEGYDFFLPVRLAKIMRDYQAPLLHTHNWDAHLYGTFAARIASVPVIIHTQHGAFHHRSWKNDLLRPMLGRLIDQFVGVSEGVSLFAKQSRWAPEEKVMTIINGVDPTPYRNPSGTGRIKIREAISIPLDAPVIINVARMNEVKDHDTLLKAFASLKTIPSAHLMLVGDGDLCSALKETAVGMGIEKFVHFMGMRTDVPDLLRAADLFVLSSLSEGISLSLLEAMSAGLPVVATDVGGNPSVVLANKTGLLVPPRNPARMANAMQMILGDKTFAKTMGEAGYARVLSDFSFNKMADAYMGRYKELLIKKGCAAWP
jgi:sugar transferase (PEP-CTERM/EpsH1 system associated)